MSSKVLNLTKKKRSLVGKRELFVVFLAVLLTTLSIRASDNMVGEKIEDGPIVGCPDGMVEIAYSGGDFCIDTYEASASRDCNYYDPKNAKETRDNLDQANCLPVSRESARPWRNISQDQAARACAKAGKRLATNKEWLQASQGTPDTSGPWTEEDCQVNSNWAEQPGPGGSAKNCVSSFGVYDMIGNVWEWVEGVVENGSFENNELPQAGYIHGTRGGGIPAETDQNSPNPDYNDDYFWLKANGIRGMLRGGYWNNQGDAGTYSLYVVTPPSQAEPGIGFRCVK